MTVFSAVALNYLGLRSFNRIRVDVSCNSDSVECVAPHLPRLLQGGAVAGDSCQEGSIS